MYKLDLAKQCENQLSKIIKTNLKKWAILLVVCLKKSGKNPAILEDLEGVNNDNRNVVATPHHCVLHVRQTAHSSLFLLGCSKFA